MKEEVLCLTADRSIFWEKERSLILSDLHFGKTGHFRKAGIAIPPSVFKDDIQRLIAQIQYFKPTTLIVVGDMFHSQANRELDLFVKWRENFPHLQILLVKGNHDILDKNWYTRAGIDIHEPALKIGKFCFQHDPQEGMRAGNEGRKDDYVFSGHIHPGITISGMGKQNLRFPCFYFTSTCCILPAFSRFTGTISIRPGEHDITFAIVNQSIMRIR